MYQSTGSPTGSYSFTDTITSVREDGFTLTTQFNGLTRTQEWSCTPEGLVALQLGGAPAAAINSQGSQLELEVNNVNGVTFPSAIEAGDQWQHNIDFTGPSAARYLDHASGLTGTISNFGLGDTIDLLGTSVTSYDFDGSTLTLTTNSGDYSYQFAAIEAGTEFNIGSDGNGGTAISLSLLSQFSASLVPDSGPDGSFVAEDATQPTQTVIAQT